MRKLSQIPAPAVAGCVREKTVRAAIAEIKNCYYDGADMIDLHITCLEDTSVETLKKIISASPLPVLALNYDQSYDRTRLHQTEEERVASLLRAVEAGAAGIDMQGYTFHAPSEKAFYGEDKYSFTKNSPEEVVTDPAIIERQCALIEKVHAMGAEVLMSCHPGIPMTTEQVVDLALFMQERKPDIIKIVTKATNRAECDEALRAMTVLKASLKTPISYHANGKAGIPTRILNPLQGGQIAFCIDRYNEGSTMEQLDLRTVRAAVDSTRRLGGI